ncbi:MAG TPA: TetR/AcrR family transcriptional regulator [Streptosporangiaceae bacterium]|nr:TetR/AcrR family transcriptional regulator [Streptosporangiaceae bacterium]
METDDEELWPPFGLGAALRPGARGPGVRGPGRDHVADHRQQLEDRRRQAADRRERQDADRHERQLAHQRQQGGSPRGGHHGRSGLTREDIVAAAIDVADRDGAEAVSMRKIAQVLRAGAMSLYWHLANKEHLIELMLDTLMGEVEVPEPSGDWRADLRAQAVSMRAVLLRHRWFIDFVGARPALGPNTLRNLDKMMALLDGLGLDTATTVNVLQTVNTYVSGAVLREFQEIRTQREQEQWLADEADFGAKLEEWKRRLARSGRYDHFLKMLEDDVDPDAESSRAERFDFGLDCLLDGIAVRLAKSQS